MKTYYIDEILNSSKRLLTLLNRNVLENTAGSFDRDFWHFKTSDFSSASFQMGAACLAKLYNLEGTSYYKNTNLLKYIERSIEFTLSIQHEDGSFDEWYVNERGWAGPTGYIMNAFLEVFELLNDELSGKAQKELKFLLNKGIDFLKKSSEGHHLANHIAMVILPLTQAKMLLGRKDVQPKLDELINLFKKVWIPEEGWSLEYDGADPGYQSGTLSFLAKCLKYEKNDFFEDVCKKSLEFISYFCYPSHFLAGSIGSRHTMTFFCSGVEACRNTPLGARLSKFVSKQFEKDTIILSSHLDDHYMIYRLNELLDAHTNVLKVRESVSVDPLPFEGTVFKKFFSKAGLYVQKTKNSYLVISLCRGGVIRLENLKGKCIINDCGVVCSRSAKIYSSLWQAENSFQFKENEFLISKELHDVSPKKFNPVTFVLFRLVSIMFVWNKTLAVRFKDLVRKALIFKGNKTNHQFKKKIVLENQKLSVEYEVELGSDLDALQIGTEFFTRHVPQSRHFTSDQHINQLDYSKLINEPKKGKHSFSYSLEF